VSAVEAPDRLEAHAPPEVRGAGRDDVALLVATRRDGELVHARFDELPRFLAAGDLLVVNTSATLPAALDARLGDRPVELRLSTPAEDALWVVELRTDAGCPLRRPPTGARLELPGGAHAELLARYAGSERLSVARLELDLPLEDYLHRHGRPIRYGYVAEAWPLDAYQTVFALEPGSAEMPSAGRPFTPELVTELVARGVLFAPVLLHTGVSSPELGEPPFPERYRVPEATARLVNAVRRWGGRVIAVGTTAVRALETVAAADGTVIAGAGRTSLVVTPERGLRAVDGLLTGWHEPESSHLLLLEASAGGELLERCYRAARERGYLWHEFGDVHLILP
jgi:S-adenosylmethionine:tRNA ribosyltransferase-isomerase